MKSLVTSSPQRSQQGMTLLEILVSSALLLVITVGLTAMFSQTQRAFRTSLKNADVYEGTRATLDLIARDLEQLSSGPYTNLHIVDTQIFPNPPVVAIGEALPDHSTHLHDFCFLTLTNNRWMGIGYRLRSAAITNGVGVGELFRFTTNYSSVVEAGNLIRDFNTAPPDQWRQVCNALVHFRVMPFSTNGYSPYTTNGNLNTLSFPQGGTFAGVNTNFFDFANCVPGYVELEMALLEPQIFEQFTGIPPANQRQYVVDHAHRVHVFRQQIPIRAAQR